MVLNFPTRMAFQCRPVFINGFRFPLFKFLNCNSNLWVYYKNKCSACFGCERNCSACIALVYVLFLRIYFCAVVSDVNVPSSLFTESKALVIPSPNFSNCLLRSPVAA